MRWFAYAVAALALVVGVLPAAGANGAGLPAWDTVPAASPAPNARLLDVAALGGGAVWAVGNTPPHPLVVRWDGARFIRVPIAGVAGRNTILEGIVGATANNLWAVGHADRTDFVGSISATYHWNGSTWTLVPSPNVGDSEAANNLLAVAAVNSADVWAVGQYVDFATLHALTLHWDGFSWQQVPNKCGSGLNGVTALATNDVWAAGADVLCHWDGQRWTPQRAPTIPGRSIDLRDIDGKAGALYAVGLEFAQCGEGVCGGGIILRRTVGGWAREASGYGLYGVKVLSASNVWAVGYWAYGPLLLHRNATAWETAATPDTPGIGSLAAVDAVSSSSLWAVGQQLVSGSTRTLALHAPSSRSGAVVGTTGAGHATVTWFGPEKGTRESDQFGLFQVGGLNAGQYTFIASQQGCTPARRDLFVPAGKTLSITLAPSC